MTYVCHRPTLTFTHDHTTEAATMFSDPDLSPLFAPSPAPAIPLPIDPTPGIWRGYSGAAGKKLPGEKLARPTTVVPMPVLMGMTSTDMVNVREDVHYIGCEDRIAHLKEVGCHC